MKIKYTLDDQIAVITMDDGKANAMDFVFFEEMGNALDQVEKDDAKILIITGRPGFFSGGLDLKVMSTISTVELDLFIETFTKIMLRIFLFPVPTIAACSGHVIAGGAILAFACDRIYSTSGFYKIQMNEVAIGMPVPSWMLLISESAVPSRWITEAILHAHVYSPKEALERDILDGLVDEGDDLIAHVKSSAGDLLNLNLDAYAVTKKRMRRQRADHVLALLKNELPGSTGH